MKYKRKGVEFRNHICLQQLEIKKAQQKKKDENETL